QSNQFDVCKQTSDDQLCHSQIDTNLSQPDTSDSLHYSSNDTSQTNTGKTENVDKIRPMAEEKRVSKLSFTWETTSKIVKTPLIRHFQSQQHSDKDSANGDLRGESLEICNPGKANSETSQNNTDNTEKVDQTEATKEKQVDKLNFES